MEDWAPPPQVEEFRVEKLIGRGATAHVWLATDTLLLRPVALKIASRPATLEMRIRFLTEARAIGRLQHPNLVAIHRAGEVAERPFLVTEVLAGASLAELALPLPAARVVAIGVDLARGLAAAHRTGVVHRDVKPANAIACADGSAKLIDFGLAKLDDDPSGARPVDPELDGLEAAWDGPPGTAALAETAPGIIAVLGAPTPQLASLGRAIVGTPLYIAPEVWLGEPATGRSDVYSLGALLHELACGQPPYTADKITELREKVIAGDAPRLFGDAAGDAALAELADLVQRCLGVDPEARPTAEELRDALTALAQVPEEQEDPRFAGANPYRGLLAFGAEHRTLFFGRDRETGAVLAELAAAAFVLVVGPSGVGKSSLVRAAVAPRVAKGALGLASGPGPVRVATLVPGRRPVEALAQAAVALGIPEREAAEQLALNPAWLAERLAQAPGERVLVVVDQLEESMTLADDEQRRRFADALTALVRAAPTVRVLATLRSDFLGKLDELGDLRDAALRGAVVLGPLSADGLARAITEPARRRGVEIEPALVERLASGAERGSLPLLSFALGKLWEKRPADARALTAEALDEIGGLEGALAAHADGVLAGLDARERAWCRRLLLGLVTVERTRARREERDLHGGDPAARRALEALVRGRLVVASEGEEGAAFEIAHEALVAGWPNLMRWLDEEAAVREARERLGRAAREWQRLGRGGEGLWGERQLEGSEIIPREELGPEETAFLAASARALGRTRSRRRALLVGVSIAAAAVALSIWGTSALHRRAAVAEVVSDARRAWGEAQTADREAASARRQAFAAFDGDDLERGEELWKAALAAEDQAEAQRQRAASILDGILAGDHEHASARALVADTTLASLERAERRHRTALAATLRARLRLYDDGSRAARLDAPARVTVVSEPAGAALTLYHYEADARQRLIAAGDRPIVPGEERALAPGSYLITASLAGRWPTRYPFVVERGERRPLRVVLPPAAAVPEGMVYVPAGRFHYGSDDDDEVRVVLEHVPGHDVDQGAFLIARTDVTYGDYLVFVRALPAAEAKARLPTGVTLDEGGGASYQMRGVRLAEGQELCLPDRPCLDWRKVPVVGVSRDDGVAYASWLAAAGRLPGARLCTDREWERAARGADARRYPHGDMAAPAADDACTIPTFARKSAGPCLAGAFPASRSPFGVDDMLGNVKQWTSDDADVAERGVGTVRGSTWSGDHLGLWLTNRTHLGYLSRMAGNGLRLCSNAP